MNCEMMLLIKSVGKLLFVPLFIILSLCLSLALSLSIHSIYLQLIWHQTMKKLYSVKIFTTKRWKNDGMMMMMREHDIRKRHADVDDDSDWTKTNSSLQNVELKSTRTKKEGKKETRKYIDEWMGFMVDMENGRFCSWHFIYLFFFSSSFCWKDVRNVFGVCNCFRLD